MGGGEWLEDLILESHGMEPSFHRRVVHEALEGPAPRANLRTVTRPGDERVLDPDAQDLGRQQLAGEESQDPDDAAPAADLSLSVSHPGTLMIHCGRCGRAVRLTGWLGGLPHFLAALNELAEEHRRCEAFS